jgi:hypothetical protein
MEGDEVSDRQARIDRRINRQINRAVGDANSKEQDVI